MKAKNFRRWDELTSAESAFEYYLGEKVIMGKMYKSPLRKDAHPTCSFWKSQKGILYFHDFGQSKMYDVVRFVMAKYSIDYAQALVKITSDIPLMVEANPLPNVKIENKFEFTPAAFSESIDYWKQYKIPLEIAAKFAFLAKSVYKNETFYGRSTKANPIFVYKFISGHIKLYRPLAEKNKKWGGNADANDIGGFYQLPRKGVLCFITSSIKDIMVLRQHGFPAICFNGEGYGKGDNEPTNKVVNTYAAILAKRFRYRLLLLDHDEAGLSASAVLSRKLRVPYVSTGLDSAKDISDYQKKYGANKTFKLLKKLIKSKFKGDEIPF